MKDEREAGGEDMAVRPACEDGGNSLAVTLGKVLLILAACVVLLPLLIPLVAVVGGLAVGLVACTLGLVLGFMGLVLKVAAGTLKLVFGLAGLAVSLLPLVLIVLGILYLLERAGDRSRREA